MREGRDGWLFLTGGRNRPLAMYHRSPGRSLRLWRWERRVRARAQRAEALGARYLHLIVPEKLSIYPELAPGDLGIDPRLSPARTLAERLADHPAFVDLVSPFEAAKADGPLYHRVDTHWNSRGCLVACGTLCAAVGTQPPSDLANRSVIEHVTAGDLGSKLDPPRTELIRNLNVERDAVRVEAGALVLRYEAAGLREALHRGARTVFACRRPATDPRRVLVFGDSAAHFAPFLLTGMLAETFRELHFVWSASVDWGLVERVRPDILVGQITERFMKQVPDDRFDLVAFEASRLAAFDAAHPPA